MIFKQVFFNDFHSMLLQDLNLYPFLGDFQSAPAMGGPGYVTVSFLLSNLF